MKKRGKKYVAALKLVDRNKFYPMTEAIDLVKQTTYSKFDASFDLSVNLGVDPRQAEQNLRGATPLPNGLGKTARIVIFAKGQKAIEANETKVDYVGAEDLAEKISGGWLDFDHVIATPDMMGLVGKLGKVLGPRGLMPNPKLGTVTFDIKTAVNELKSGRAEFRVDKNGIIHASIGKVSMEADKIKGNIEAVIEALQKLKPSTAKGTYLKAISLSSTMSPGVRVDAASYR